MQVINEINKKVLSVCNINNSICNRSQEDVLSGYIYSYKEQGWGLGILIAISRKPGYFPCLKQL